MEPLQPLWLTVTLLTEHSLWCFLLSDSTSCATLRRTSARPCPALPLQVGRSSLLLPPAAQELNAALCPSYCSSPAPLQTTTSQSWRRNWSLCCRSRSPTPSWTFQRFRPVVYGPPCPSSRRSTPSGPLRPTQVGSALLCFFCYCGTAKGQCWPIIYY